MARADALERALDEARGAAGAELLAGVDGVVGTLLDLVEVDAGLEEAFEAAAGASVAAVVVSGSEPARAALSRLRQGGATGAVLALTAGRPAGSEAAGAVRRLEPGPSPSAAMCGRVRETATSRASMPCSTPCCRVVCARGGWSEAIDLALARPDLVVVTRDGTGSPRPAGGCGPAAAW